MKRWEQVDNYLQTFGPVSFSSRDLAADLGVSGREASHLIQAYLTEQRRSPSGASVVLHRVGRTKQAVWMVGDRANDAREMSRQWFDDVARHVAIALKPDLDRIGVSNARATQVTTAIANVVEASLQLLAAQL